MDQTFGRAPRLNALETMTFAAACRRSGWAVGGQGRDRDAFPLAKRIYVAIDDDADRARSRTADALAGGYGRAFASTLMPVTVTGPADCVRGVQEVADAGAGPVLLTALFDEAEQLERFAAEVIPQVS